MKKHKSSTPKEPKASNSTAEVFVLPPDLLAKLGINLVTIQQPQITPPISQPTSSRVKETEQSIDHIISNNLKENEDSTSIIETANLMKESVFLSPTFFQTPTVSETYEDASIPNGDTIIQTNNISNSLPELVSEVNKNSQQSTSKLAKNRNSSEQTLAEQSILISADRPRQNSTDPLPSDKSGARILVDDHADEAYLSDFSNSHSGCSPESTNSEVNKQKLHKNKAICNLDEDLHFNNTEVEDMNVVSLQSEVVSDPVIMESENLDNIHTDKAENESVKVTSVNRNAIAEHATISNSKNNALSLSTLEAEQLAGKRNQKSKVDPDKVKVQDKNSLGNVEEKNTDFPKVSNIPVIPQEETSLPSNNYSSTPIDLNRCEKVNIDNSPKEKTSAIYKEKQKTAEITNNSEDKVKEIAAYLRQIVTERNTKIRRKSKNKDQEMNVDPTISKICIQGVEKPGGKDIPEENWEITKVSRTYQKSIRNRNNRKMTKPEIITIADSFQLTHNKNFRQVGSTEVRALKHQNEFCICFDFGDLNYYDCEMLYEHLHFCLHKNIECDTETLYSIYDEDNILKPSVDFVEDGPRDGPSNEQTDVDTIQNRLCWNEINSNLDDNIDGKLCETNDAKLSSVKNATSALEIVKNIDSATTMSLKEVKPTQICTRKSLNLETISKNIEDNIEKSSKRSEKSKNKSTDKRPDSSKKGLEKSSKALKKSSKNNEDTNEKLIKERGKSTNKLTDETPNISSIAINESSKVLKETSKNSKDRIENSIREREKSTNTASDESSKSCNKAMNESSKALNKSLSKRKSSTNTPTNSDSTNSKKDHSMHTKNANDSLNKEQTKTTRDINNDPIATPRSTRASRSRSSKLNSVDNEDIRSSNDDVRKGPSKNVTGSNTDSPSEKATKTKTQPPASSKSEEKLKVPKSGKRPSNTITIDSPAKKAKIMPSDKTGDEKSIRRTRSDRLSKAKNTNDTVDQGESEHSYNMAEACITDIQATPNTNAYITKREPETSDDEILYEVSIISDTTMNDTQTTETSEVAEETEMMHEVSTITETTTNDTQFSEPADSTVVDSTIIDTTFDDTQPVECSTPSVQGSTKPVKCAVCGTYMKKSQWNEHMWKEHNYLAWREGDKPLDLEDDDLLRIHIQAISNKNGGLECSKCNVKRKHAKPFLRHIQTCSQPEAEKKTDRTVETVISEDITEDTPRKSRVKQPLPPFTCAVCNMSVEQSNWIEHIQVNHNYMAWTTDETPLNLEDEAEVKEHLRYISKYNGGLKCQTCGSHWAYAKKFLDHKCTNEKQEVDLSHGEVVMDLPDVVTCGVCKLNVRGIDWIKHIQVAHEYMAWIDGRTPLDPNDPDQVKAHLDAIVNTAGELICTRCGERRRKTFGYLQHHTACVNSGFNIIMGINEPDTSVAKDQYICGVCHDIGYISQWREHAMSKHYNIAWRVGEIPINLRNPYAVEKYLKVYKRKRGLTCLICKETRTSCYGFYAHILTCGRTPEEMDGVLNECEICHNKYLCIYRSQHMAAHRDSDMRREKRETMVMQAGEGGRDPLPEVELLRPMGKRKAAEKAKKVIKNHTSNMIDGKPVCGCGAMFEDAAEFAAHYCNKKVGDDDDDDDDSDDSVKIERDDVASDDEEYAMIDSGVSDEEVELPRKRIRHKPENNKVQRLQYKIENCSGYLCEAFKDFATTHYTDESLFNIWRNSAYTVVPPEEREKYLPQLTESCKIMIGKEEATWITYKRFEARKLVYSFFTGGAISCISWAPPNLNYKTLNFYLAVSTHRGPDVPRHSAGETPVHPGLLQIWDFGDFESSPYCALTLAHDYGIVWSIDWCPSGARDGPAPPVPLKSRVEATAARLGLLAIACSNGSVYVLAVPVPPPHEAEQEPPMYKLNPVAELRLTMTPERRVYQATSVKWSPQKGHSVIIVGYSDGTTALFDLNTESPFLATMEGEVTVYYPFQDRRSESTSITSVGVLTTTNESCAVGGQFSTSMCGGTLSGRVGRPSARCHLATSGALHAASWPAVALSGDVPFMRASSELEWWGGGRRLGAARAWAACARCARAASAAQPAVRLHYNHPVYAEIKKLISALLVMTPLQKTSKKKKKENDEMSVVVEPLTYHDAAATYGLQFYTIPKKRSAQALAQQICNKDEFKPERFPLADIVAMAFCPSNRHHDRLALASHTGQAFDHQLT